MSRSTALVTGASSGIGRELAKVLAENGHDLVLVARRRERLEELKREISLAHSTSIEVLARDLEDPSTPARIVEELDARGTTLDVLVNNAGFGAYGRFRHADLARLLAMIQVNLVALTELTRRLLPGMVSRRRGTIVNVASVAAFQPGPIMAVYAATKAYVLSFSEALAEELNETGVTVTALCPGLVATEFQAVAGLERSFHYRSPLAMNAREVAEIGYAAARKGKPLVIPGLGNKLLVQALRLAPRRLVTAAAARFQKKRSGGTCS